MVSAELFGETGVMFETMREDSRAGCAEGVCSPEIVVSRRLWNLLLSFLFGDLHIFDVTGSLFCRCI